MCERLADRIRMFALERYIEPAREACQRNVTIRAGDVHDAMGLANQMPAVCGALGTDLFLGLACVKRVGRSGPANGANARFDFELE